MRTRNLLHATVFACLLVGGAGGDEPAAAGGDACAGIATQIARGRLDEARAVLDALWTDPAGWPAPPRAATLWARWALEAGAYAELVQRDRALSSVPAPEGVSRSLWTAMAAEALRRTGGYEEAERRLRALVEADAGDLPARVALAELLAWRGRIEEASATLAPLGSLDSGALLRQPDGETLLWAARGLFLLGELTGESKHLQGAMGWAIPHAARALGEDPRPRVLEARQFLAAGQRVDARESLREALRIRPGCPEALLMLGRSDAALAARPAWEEARLAVALQHMGVDLGVEDLLRPPPPEGGGDGAPFLSEPVFDPKPEDDRIATQHVDAALALNPSSPQALSVAAAQKYLAGDQAGFDALCARAWEVAPTCGEMHFWLSERAHNPRDARESLGWARRCLERDPRHLRALLSAGLSCMNEGFEEEGRTHFENAWRLYPFNVTAYNYLKLLESYPEHFAVQETEHFRIRVRKREADLLLPEAARVLEEGYEDLRTRYGFEPEIPIRVELFDDPQDFAVRTLGMPGAPYAGVCLGRVITCQSAGALAPKGDVWEETLHHELAHIFTTQMSNGWVSRWFSEGLSTREERRRHAAWDWEEHTDQKLVSRLALGTLAPIPEFEREFRDDPRLAYYHASLLCEYIEERFGFAAIPRMLAAYGKGTGARTPMAEMLLAWTGKRDADVVREALEVSLDELDGAFRVWLRARLPEEGVLPVLYPVAAIGQLQEAYGGGSDPVAGARLARALFQHGRKDEAEEVARSLAGRPDSPADVHVVMGHIAFDRDQYAAARASYERAFAAGSKDFYATFAMGRLAEEESADAGEEAMREAARWYVQAQERYGRSVYDPYHTYKALGRVYRRLGDAEGERAQVVRWMGIVQGDVGTRRWLARRLAAEQDHEGVVRYASEIRWTDPADFDARRLSAASLQALGMRDEAIEEYRLAVRASRALPGNDPEREDVWMLSLHLGLAELLHARGAPQDLEEAREAVRRAREISWEDERAKALEAALGGGGGAAPEGG